MAKPDPPFRAAHLGSLLRDRNRLCVSPQCGFPSAIHGNAITEDDQWATLAHVVEVADEIWA